MTAQVVQEPRLSDEVFYQLRDDVSAYCGVSIPFDNKFLMERRLRERLSALDLPSFSAYHRYLRFHPNGRSELERAVDVLTIRETYFFRQPGQLESFEQEVLPVLHGQAARRRRLVVWSAGCSTGEEVYTLAILVLRSGLFEGWNVSIFGSDISGYALKCAHQGVFGESSFRAMPEIDDAYFVTTDHGRQVHPRIRAMCQFRHVNLIDKQQAAGVGRVDAVFCRNVLIYFDQSSRKKAVEVFYERLYPGGYLMLGHSESLLNTSSGFMLAPLSGDLAYRKPF